MDENLKCSKCGEPLEENDTEGLCASCAEQRKEDFADFSTHSYTREELLDLPLLPCITRFLIYPYIRSFVFFAATVAVLGFGEGYPDEGGWVGFSFICGAVCSGIVARPKLQIPDWHLNPSEEAIENHFRGKGEKMYHRVELLAPEVAEKSDDSQTGSGSTLALVFDIVEKFSTSVSKRIILLADTGKVRFAILPGHQYRLRGRKTAVVTKTSGGKDVQIIYYDIHSLKYLGAEDAESLRKLGWHPNNKSDRIHFLLAEGDVDALQAPEEWCEDIYSPNYDDTLVADPRGAVTGNRRVMRGGSWFRGPSLCRSAARNARNPSGRKLYDKVVGSS